MTPPRLPAEINRLVGQAMHRYRMLADGDRVMIAVSGGVDSLVLCRVLDLWCRKAPINYQLYPVHLDMGFGGYTDISTKRPRPGGEAEGSAREIDTESETEPQKKTDSSHQDQAANPRRVAPKEPLTGTATAVGAELEKTGLPHIMEETTYGPEALEAEEGKNGCYHCATRRRARLFALAREHGCNKLALGHHQEDIIETFFLNLLYGGNISTMVPSQPLFNGNLTLIRPLALLSKEMIHQLGRLFGITAVPNPCPLNENSKRHSVRQLLNQLREQHPNLNANVFAALGNVRPEYLL